MQHDLLVVEAISRDANIIDDIVLKMFFIYVVNVTTKNSLERTHEKQSFFIKMNIVDADVILKMKWLKKMNFILNFAKKIWILWNNALSVSNRAWSESKSIMISMIEFIVKCLNWAQWYKSLKNEKQMMYATFQKNESKDIIAIIDVIEKNSSNSSINEIVFFSCYSEYVDVFSSVSFEKLLKRNSYNHAIKIISKKKFLFDFIYSLSQTKLDVLRKYINENEKKS